MKITKTQLKQIIKEEIESLPIENLIGGISGLVNGMDPELVGVVFTTVFKEIETPGARPEVNEPEEPEAVTPIGFDREPEQVSSNEPNQIGFQEELRKLVKQQVTALMNEDKDDKGKCPPDGCVQKRGDKWVVISNKTGECWGRSKKESGKCTDFGSRQDAEDAIAAYHA